MPPDTTTLHLQLCETVNPKNGIRRYYVNSKRVSLQAFRDAKFMATLDTFNTLHTRGLVKMFCCARKPRWA